MEPFWSSVIGRKDVNEEKDEEAMPSVDILLEDFKAIQNPAIDRIMHLLPLLITLFIIFILIMKYLNLLDDIILGWLPIIISAYIACVLCLSAFCVFMKKIPETFRELWRREIIVDVRSDLYKNNSSKISKGFSVFCEFLKNIPETFCELWRRFILAVSSNLSTYNMNIKNSKTTASTNIHLEDKFAHFIYDLQTELNKRSQWSIGLLVLLLTLLWNLPLSTLIPSMESLDSLTRWNQTEVWQIFIGDNWHLFNEIPDIVLAFFIGFMLWRMYATSKYICKLMNEFQIEPKLGHPDTAGGLSPLGNLCLLSFIITNVPFIHLSGWLLLGTLKKFKSPLPELPNYYIYSFSILLVSFSLIPFVACFLIPVWKVHQRMIEWRDSKQEQLCQVGRKINKLESTLLNKTEKLDSKEFESIQKELNGWKEVYIRNEKLPIWPFNVEIRWKLLIAYIIPILGLISIAFLNLIGLEGSNNLDGLMLYTPVLGLIFQLFSLIRINYKM